MIIKSIEEFSNKQLGPQPTLWEEAYDGFRVVTDEGTYFVALTSYQSCCEDWGFLTSEDDLSSFVGAELRAVKVVDEEFRKTEPIDYYDGGACFVDFETSEGVFQLAVYNSHNGYYGHKVHVCFVENGKEYKDAKAIHEETL